MRAARILACLPFVLLVASCGDTATAALTVRVRTDWVPGVEFGAVLVDLDAPGVEPTTQPAFVFEDYAEGVRVAELSGLPTGTHRLVVALLSPGSGERLDEASLRVDLRENDTLDVTVLLTREARACDGASDCTSSVACVEGSCVDGNCLFAPQNDRCAPTEYCDPEDGCLLREIDGGAPVTDGGGRDGGSDGGVSPDAPSCTGPSVLWRRSPEWTRGPVPGASDGNPSPDPMGRRTWFYEATRGGPIGASDVWYAEPAELLVWDDSWFGDAGGWAISDDVGPVVLQPDLTHITSSSWFARAPRVRWHNPTGRPLLLTVAGALTLYWAGEGGAPNISADVAIVRLDGSLRPAEVLLESTVEKPTADTSSENVRIGVAPRPILVGADDSIVVSVRGEREWEQAWMILVDDLTYSGVECE